MDEDLKGRVEAVVAFSADFESSSLKDADVFEDASSRLLVVDRFKRPEDRETAFEFGLDREIEVVDFEEEAELRGDDEDEKRPFETAANRVVQSLQTCMWSNMETKKKKQEEKALNENGDFEKLFAQFANFRDSARNLPESERKKHAENVVRQFWDAIGGDDAEFDSSDNE